MESFSLPPWRPPPQLDPLLLVPSSDALRSALEARGFQVTTAESVAEAMQLLRDKAPAFAVLDMRLEDGNGLKIVEAVREAASVKYRAFAEAAWMICRPRVQPCAKTSSPSLPAP